MNLFLQANPPFNFYSTVCSHGWYQLAPCTWDEEQQALGRIERLNSGRVVQMHITGEPDGVRVAVKGRVGAADEREIGEKIAWMFALNADFTEFYVLADQEPRLAHVRAKAYGRLLRSTSIFEDVVKTMMTTNIQWGGTKRLTAALVHRFGEPSPTDTTQRAFPLPDAIARSRETTLRKLGIGYRAPYLLQLARGVVAGKINLEALRDASRPTADVRRDLLAVPGIGPYAAATLLGILGRYDFIGVDTEAVRLVSKHFYDNQPVGEKEVYAVFGAWGKFKSLAYWFWDYAGQQQTPMDAWETRAVPSDES